MKALSNNISEVALIFEGGGMRASYTSGVVNTLIENELFFDNVYGLSAGSSNAVNYVSRDISRTKRSFVDIVTYPGFGGVGTFLQHKGIFSAKRIYEEMGKPNDVLPFDMETFLANPAKVTIQAFARDTGESVYWTKGDLDTLDNLMRRVRASSTLPIAMPSPCIDGVHYYDGGLGEGAGFMLPRAIADGFKRFFIVRTRPRGFRKPEARTAGDRLMDAALWRRPFLRRAYDTRNVRYNPLCSQIEQLEQEGAAYVFYAEGMEVNSGTTKLAALQRSYDTGYAQAQDELPAMKRWLQQVR